MSVYNMNLFGLIESDVMVIAFYYMIIVSCLELRKTNVDQYKVMYISGGIALVYAASMAAGGTSIPALAMRILFPLLMVSILNVKINTNKYFIKSIFFIICLGSIAIAIAQKIYIPNSDAASARICNYSVEGRRRVDLYIGVSYDAPAEKVREALLAAAQHPKALQDPAPLVVLNNYQDSSIQYLLMLWTASGDYLDVRFAVNEAVKRELDARGIAIPYPQLDVHFDPQKRNT